MKKPITNSAEINLRGENDTDRILGNPPGWILRWGLLILLAATIVFGLLSWWVKYPDVIPAPVSFVSENPPVKVLTLRGGKIEKLLVENNASVELFQLLAVLENPAKANDIEHLKLFLSKTTKAIEHSNLSKLNPAENLTLGSLQNTYAELIFKIKNYRQYSEQRSAGQKINSIKNQIENIRKLNANLLKQQKTLEEETALARKEYERNLSLNKIGEVSVSAVEESKTAYLQYRRQAEGFENRMLDNKVNISSLETQIIELKEDRNLGHSDKKLTIEETVQRLRSEVAAWELNYLITAPAAGHVSFSENWTDRQFVNPGEELFTIIPPEGSGEIIGRALLPIAGSGKVEAGQTAHIRLSGYPYREFGILKTKVKNIAPIPQDDRYQIELELTDGLKTTYGKSIPFRQEMQGTANIITEDRRVVERIFDTILSLFKNG